MKANESTQKRRTRTIIAALALLLAAAGLLVSSPGLGSHAQQSGSRQLAQVATVREWPGKAKRWALVIGVDQYHDGNISALRGAANDAATLARALTQYAGFPADQVILLATDQPEERQPTRINILSYLSNIAAAVPKDGLLLVSFAGHGLERGGQAYLIPSDARLTDDVTLLEESAVSVQRMHNRIRSTGVAQVVVLLDACRNDPGGRADAPNNLTAAYTNGFNFDVRNREVQAYATIYATAVGQRAFEYVEKKQGYFSWAIVEGLKGAAANERGEVTLAALVKYVQDTVPKRVAIDLGAGKQQRPFANIDGYLAADLVVAVSQPPAATSSPTTSGLSNNGGTTQPSKIDAVAIEREYWETIHGSSDAQDFKDYLQTYPSGAYAGVARAKIRQLETAGNTRSAVPPPTKALIGHGFDRANLDTSTAACTDFYQYANGGWIAANPIPASFSSWGAANALSDKNRDLLHEILEAAARNSESLNGSEQKIGNYYATCMDEAKIEAEGLKALQPELDNIARVNDQRALQKEIAQLHSIGVNVPFYAHSNLDFKNSEEVIVEILQGGLGLPDRDYYSDERRKTIRDEYLRHVAKMFELMGDDAALATTEAQIVITLEGKLAAASKSRAELRDPEKLYHRMPMLRVSDLAPNFDWVTYFQRIGLQQKADVNVATPDFFRALDALLTGTPVADWRTYLRWHLINNAASGLSSRFVDEDFRFKGTILSGTKENLPRWRRCVTATDRALGDALGEVFVQKAFPPSAKARALEMVRNLEAALKDDLNSLTWMGDAPRRQAILKVDTLLNKIGYPDQWRNYSGLSIDRVSYLNNRVRVAQYNERRDLATIGKPLDRTEWNMTPPTVNAYYNPQVNEIVFPAGILQPPFFDAEADDAFNYGAIGAVIGHEMTHGFDESGRLFDFNGNLANWWTDAELSAFKERAQCVVDQFNSFEVEKGLNENGRLVAGESIADLGGLLIAYTAYEKSLEGKPRTVIDGFTPEQRFFLGYARGWASNLRPEFARLLVNTDPHPLAKFRVNGPVSNLPQFAAAFQCQAGDAMVRAAKDRCRIW